MNPQPLAPKHGSPSCIESTVIILILLLGLLFVARWVYRSQRSRRITTCPENNRRSLSSSPHLDDILFTSEDSDVFLKAPSEKGKSGFLVGLFGSPSWETKYYNILQTTSGHISLNYTLQPTATFRHHGSKYGFTVSPQNKQLKDLSLCRSYFHGLSKAELGLRTFSEPSDYEPLLAKPSLAITSNTYLPWNLENGMEVYSTPMFLSTPASPPLMARHISSLSKDLCDTSVCESLTNSSTVRIIPDRSALSSIIDFPEPSHSSTPGFHDSHRSSPSNCRSMHASSSDTVGRVRRASLAALESKSHFFPASDTNSKAKTFQIILDGNEATVEQAKNICSVSSPSTLAHTLQSINSDSAQDCNEYLSAAHNWNTSMSTSRCASDVFKLSEIREHETILSPTYDSVVDTDALEPFKPNLRILSSSQSRKRSPKVGPSPLRTTFLPDSGDNTNRPRRSCSQYRDVSKENFNSIEQSPLGTVTNSGVKLSGGHRSKPNGYHTKSRDKIFKERTKSQDSESLFNLMHELVQEASAWDDSLFVNHKFRAMINDSKRVVAVSFPNKHKGWRRSHRLQRPRIRILEGIPEMEAEIVLGEDDVVENLKSSGSFF